MPPNRSPRRPDPMLLGRPSPSLARIGRMNIAELEQRIERLREEAAHLNRRVENLRNLEPQPFDRIEKLSMEIKRLGLLKRAARQRLEAKQKRRETLGGEPVTR